MERGQVTGADIQSVSDGAGVARLLAALGYDVSEPSEQTAAGLGIAERVQHLIKTARRLVGQRAAPGLPPALEIYWFETTTLTADLRQAVVASFRNKPARVLLVMTTRDFAQLDFVLVERSLAAAASGAQVSVSHQLFSVDRRHPSRVHLRVVNRMANVAPDPYAQYDRIHDAFQLAEWSEDEFNNRNLFSDYFLKHRLPQQSEFPVWHSEVKPAFKQLAGIYQNAGDVRSLQADDYLKKFIRPMLQGLGFAADPSAAKDGHADYLLRPSGAAKGDAPIAGLLVYPWDRPLDRKDDQDRPRAEDVPGIRIVRVLEDQKLPWAILTNGKDWRLYCAQAHSRATNYYEIDLPDALEHQDLGAFRYFYFFFRAEAFTPPQARQLCFLDRLREGSAAFAKELGDRLRKHIFDAVFPYLAQGFVDFRRQAMEEKTPAGDAFLDRAYDATLTLLYRLLFLLYAESLDLLPVHEPAYADLSLSRLKVQIATAAGAMTENVENRLKEKFTKHDTALYDRLTRLFIIIDKGSQAHNVPVYNGGLFSTEPAEGDDSREAEAARFLQKHKVPDFYLARALDLLARSEDAKTGDLVFVDYKSLGVRQLGSVYEGLLMYHVVMPHDDWEKGFQRPGLKVALVPSNKERKNTGSYFTPQHIVKYIVSQTVGPLLEEKFKEATPKLRAAQREYHDRRKFDESQPPVLRKAEEITFRNHVGVVRELLDVKVLDPAMGSGHFLVETVDFITDRLLNFLAGFPWNPVQVFVERRVRQPIVESLESQGVKMNEQRLTDVNLIKRLVMKRCAYGVDLNPMAVELAKVSVWLDSFTIGAPLSFMDHHFKCGNSLIGSSITDLQKLVDEQGGLWSIPMEPLERATRNMELIADLSDVTLSEVHQSADTYQRVLAGIEGYRVLLDCMTAEYFDVEGASALVTQGHDLDLEHWNEASMTLQLKERNWVDKATKASATRHFLHWDVDFPDVFFASHRTTGNRGFDAVVGNPPYDELSEDDAGIPLPEKEYLDRSIRFLPARGGRQNIFRYFTVLAVNLLRPSGHHSFIVPMAILTDQFTANLRRWLLKNTRVSGIEAFPQKDDIHRRVFLEAKLSTCLYQLAKASPAGNDTIVRTNPANTIDPTSPHYSVKQSWFEENDPKGSGIPSMNSSEQLLVIKVTSAQRVCTIGDVGKALSGEIVFNKQFEKWLTTKPTEVLLVRGGNIGRYTYILEPKQGSPVYLDWDGIASTARPDSKLFDCKYERVAYQEVSPIDNYRRLIGTHLPKGKVLAHTVSSIKQNLYNPYALLALFNSSLLEWRFNATSTNNHVNAYEVSALPIPRFDVATTSPTSQLKVAEMPVADLDKHVLHIVESVPAADESWPLKLHDFMAALGNVHCSLGTAKEKLQLEFCQRLKESITPSEFDDWTGSTSLRNLDYLGWRGRFSSTQLLQAEFDNGVCPPLPGTGPGDLPWELIARVFPSYPLPGIDPATWERTAWEDFCSFLRKNKGKIGNSRVRGELTGTGAVSAPTGPMKKLQDLFLRYHQEVRKNRAKAAELDFLIDRIVFRLFNLTLDEQKLILSRVGPGRPLPPRRGRGRMKAAVKDEGPGLFTSESG